MPVSSQVDVVQLVCVSHGHVGTAGKQAVKCPGSKGVILNGEVQAQICCVALIPGKKSQDLLGRKVSICWEEESYLLGNRTAASMWGHSNLGQSKFEAIQIWGSSKVGQFRRGAVLVVQR